MPRFRIWSVPPIVGFVMVLLLAIPFHLRPENFIVDDGYFYPEIAQHIVSGEGSTFNGITPTNGYHPLWMLVSILAASITAKATALVQILGGIQDILLASAAFVLMAVARAARLRGAFLGCLAFLFFSMVLGIWRLIEAPLALSLQITALLLAVPALPTIQQRLKGWRAPLLGLVLGLTVLARLDLIFFAIVMLGYLLSAATGASPSLKARACQTFLAGGVAVLVVAPYLLWNWELFHHLLPISGAIKNTFPHVQPWHFQSFTLPVVAAIVLNLARIPVMGRTPYGTLCLLNSIAASLHLGYTLSFGELAPWYLTTGYLSLALCIAWVTEAVLQRLPRISWVEFPLTAALCLTFFTVGCLRAKSNLSFTRITHGTVSLHGEYREPKRALAERLDDAFPRNTRMFIFDAPGGVALYSKMSFLPVDGLVSDYRYNSELVEMGAVGYAARHNIQYFVGPKVGAGQTYDRLFLRGYRTTTGQAFNIQAPLLKRAAGTILLPDRNLVFTFREINPELEGTFPEIGVWRLESQ